MIFYLIKMGGHHSILDIDLGNDRVLLMMSDNYAHNIQEHSRLTHDDSGPLDLGWIQ